MSRLLDASEMVKMELKILSRNPSAELKAKLAAKMRLSLSSTSLLGERGNSGDINVDSLAQVSAKQEETSKDRVKIQGNQGIQGGRTRRLHPKSGRSSIADHDLDLMYYETEMTENTPVHHLKDSSVLSQARTPRPNVKKVLKPSLAQNRAMAIETILPKRSPHSLEVNVRPKEGKLLKKSPVKPDFVVPFSGPDVTTKSGLKNVKLDKDHEQERVLLLKDTDHRLKLALAKLLKQSVQNQFASSSVHHSSHYKTPSKPLKTPSKEGKEVKPRAPLSATKRLESQPKSILKSPTPSTLKLNKSPRQSTESLSVQTMMMDQMKAFLSEKLDPFVLDTKSKVDMLVKSLEDGHFSKKSTERVPFESLNANDEAELIENEVMNLESHVYWDSPSPLPFVQDEGQVIELSATPPPLSSDIVGVPVEEPKKGVDGFLGSTHVDRGDPTDPDTIIIHGTHAHVIEDPQLVFDQPILKTQVLWLPLSVQHGIKVDRQVRLDYLRQSLGDSFEIEGPWDAIKA